MNIIRKSRWVKVFAIILTLSFLAEIGSPSIAWALTSGPGQPEFSSFEPVTTSNMVDPFTGAFTYNLPVLDIPGPNGGGYALGLNYHSGVTPEEESSWCGLGWTLNPGAINRSKSGFADDFNGNEVKFYHKSVASTTVSLGVVFDVEALSADLGFISASRALRYNNYKGLGVSTSFGATFLDGISTLSVNFDDDGNHGFDLSVNPFASRQRKLSAASRAARKQAEGFSGHLISRRQLYNAISREANAAQFGRSKMAQAASTYKMDINYSENFPSASSEMQGFSTHFRMTGEGTPLPIDLGPEAGFTASLSRRANATDMDVLNVQGAMYPTNGNSEINDYFMEKDASFNKRDYYLPIPFRNKDVFSVTGEGVMGGFKVHQRKVGHFRPRKIDQSFLAYDAGLDLDAGTDIGFGAQVSGGVQRLTVDNWENQGNTNTWDFTYGDEEPVFFKYMNDKGSNLRYSTGEGVQKAKLVRVNNSEYYPQIEALSHENYGGVVSRSSNIDYNTYSSVNKSIVSLDESRDVNYNAFSKSNKYFSGDELNRGSANVGNDAIAEFATTNKNGQKYVYGHPVYSADEATLSFSTNKYQEPTNSSIIYNDDLSGNVDTDVGNSSVKAIEGQYVGDPYAQSYLLTEIHTPDYIDKTFDGPTNDDFGGWTKFNYRQKHGSKDKKSGHDDWYRWRFPYKGLHYNRNSLSDRRDDRGAVQSGVKEVYFMESIETKTHVAIFVTNASDYSEKFVHVDGNDLSILKGSQDARLDGIEAQSEATALTENSQDVPTAGELEKLERIVLFAKNDDGQLVGKPLKVANLEYDYDLCKGVPNHLYSHNEIPESTGKLTLKKLWFEYEGVVPQRIRPYEFDYEYKSAQEFGAGLPDDYDDIINYKTIGLNENPDFNDFLKDAWGNVRSDEENRARFLKPWVQQDQVSANFDPAAWNLKQVKLPSGGEILVHYEQHKYATVMHKKATQFVSLADHSNGEDSQGLIEGFKLNNNDVDVDYNHDGIESQDEIDEYADELREYLEDQNERLYFKLLYQLTPDGNQSVLPEHCNVEYITGYVHATVEHADGSPEIWINTTGEGFQLPSSVCHDFYKKNRDGLVLHENCYKDPDEGMENGAQTAGDAGRYILKVIDKFLMGGVFTQGGSCVAMSDGHSYLKLPVPVAKKGGGVRVKRIMMYDEGLSGDDSKTLYGTEYIYQDLEGNCSGVATNEPSAIREENTLVGFDENRAPQNLASVVLAGKDKDQFEGPIGESILPPPSVNYSSIISQNIHKGKTAPGFQHQEFYTYADSSLSLLNESFWEVSDLNAKKQWVPSISLLGSGVGRSRSWATQGYVFIQHDLHGKPKSMTTYGGVFSGQGAAELVANASTQYEYSLPGEGVTTLLNSGEILEDNFIGVEEEVTMSTSEVKDRFIKGGAQLDPNIAIFPPGLANFSIFPFLNDNFSSHARHVTSKVLHYTTVLKSTVSTTDGITHKTENLVFDVNTGDPVVVRTSDGFDGRMIANSTEHKGKYINYTIPAAHVYKHLRQKSTNQNFELDGVFELEGDCIFEMANKTWLGDDPICHQHNGFINLNTEEGADLPDAVLNWTTFPKNEDNDWVANPNAAGILLSIQEGKLIEGDLIKLTSGQDEALFYISEIDLEFKRRIALQPLSFVANQLIDNPDGAVFTHLEVIESGYKNQLQTATASITTYGEDNYKSGGLFDQNSTQIKLKDNLENVVAAAVTTYSDDWYDYQLTDAYSGMEFDCTIPQSYEHGTKGRWRPKSSYVYKSDVEASSAARTNGVYDGGVYTLANGFVFKDAAVDVYLSGMSSNTGEFTNEPTQVAAWVQTNTVTKYSPHGEPLEEQNALGIKSTAKFGYNENVPVLVAANAPFNSCEFRSFEDETPERYITDLKAHSGVKSMRVNGTKTLPIANVEAPNSITGNSDMLVKFWCSGRETVLSDLETELQVSFYSDGYPLAVASFKRVARVGEWVLVEARVDNLKVAESENLAYDLYLNEITKTGRGPGIDYQVSIENLNSKPVFIDDIRVQPVLAEMTTYVYNPENLRLLASFDDQHFGLFYQYNAEGQLVRKLIETERGIKTVTETQYHVPSQVRVQN